MWSRLVSNNNTLLLDFNTCKFNIGLLMERLLHKDLAYKIPSGYILWVLTRFLWNFLPFSLSHFIFFPLIFIYQFFPLLHFLPCWYYTISIFLNYEVLENIFDIVRTDPSRPKTSEVTESDCFNIFITSFLLDLYK